MVMKKTDLMIFAPHEDDELAIAGPVIYQAAQKGMDVKVVFTTNGDYFPHEGPIRIKEAIKALHILGVEKENIIFLGYGDQTQSKHLYNAPNKEVVCSYNGKTATYGIPGVEEFAMSEYGEHHAYTRENYKGDIKAVLEKYLPEIVITTDWDNHMDHLALSLMLDEVLGEVLKERRNYHPLVLKSQSYTGKWEGREDYYEAENVTEHVNLACGVEKVHPLNKWEDRIRFQVPKACRTALLKDNVLYKAACAYKSQYVDLKAPQFINKDVVFWRRHTEGFSYRAKIKVSSGQSEFLNDFKCFDCSDIINDFYHYDQSIWVTEVSDTEKKIEIELEEKAVLREICFYENPSEACRIQNIAISFDNGEQINTGALYHDGSKTSIAISSDKAVKCMTLVIDKWDGSEIGLTEIEIYGEVYPLSHYQFPLPLWDDAVLEEQESDKKAKLEQKLFRIKKYARGRLWPDKYFLMKRYDSLKESDGMFVFWCKYFQFVAEKLLEKIK